MFPHACTVTSRSQRHTLAFTAGTAAIVAGHVITGATSHATATVISVTLTSGTWAGRNAAGSLLLHLVTGTFQAEAITSTTGAATASGASVPVAGSLGTPTYQWSSVATDCEFWDEKGEEAPVRIQGETPNHVPMVKIPPTIPIAPNTYRIVSTWPNYVGTFAVVAVTKAPGLYGSVHHYEVQLEEVPA